MIKTLRKLREKYPVDTVLVLCNECYDKLLNNSTRPDEETTHIVDFVQGMPGEFMGFKIEKIGERNEKK